MAFFLALLAPLSFSNHGILGLLPNWHNFWSLLKVGVWLLIFQAASRWLNLGCVIPRDVPKQCAQNFWLFTLPLNSKVKGIKLSEWSFGRRNTEEETQKKYRRNTVLQYENLSGFWITLHLPHPLWTGFMCWLHEQRGTDFGHDLGNSLYIIMYNKPKAAMPKQACLWKGTPPAHF